MFRKSFFAALNLTNHQLATKQTSLGKKFSTSHNLDKVNFEGLKKLLKNPGAVVIDVREPEELLEHGSIPNAINIPLGQVETVLKDMPETEFAKTFGRNKPSKETPIVFSCMKGVRSEKAQIAALGLSYKNVKNYTGGWIDFHEKCKNPHS